MAVCAVTAVFFLCTEATTKGVLLGAGPVAAAALLTSSRWRRGEGAGVAAPLRVLVALVPLVLFTGLVWDALGRRLP